MVNVATAATEITHSIIGVDDMGRSTGEVPYPSKGEAHRDLVDGLTLRDPMVMRRAVFLALVETSLEQGKAIQREVQEVVMTDRAKGYFREILIAVLTKNMKDVVQSRTVNTRSGAHIRVRECLAGMHLFGKQNNVWLVGKDRLNGPDVKLLKLS